ncbi:UDP-3-O-acyl-N-acetylglucosamine deacetylase [Sulfurovum sp.]|jgi:UDP-3-O-[3-hydroxymyristoyl] N-acetylglucosamine deacetylase|uniref:UDP-3-O-acyl-N-acetylglucosamine deacetylase n=1 Tax=Sulfurovum sp. TaxID=1969726 RepID=UPI002A35C26D|nr:UDP-3-O-acyl-N-acetylglucosamine deacetylase [Sulfurovum sp.]MDD2451351.1 UDP-3-O-acyl-N-acetylglucosamine deacetylase [Sulfurovum sp.]MDD3499912.1 UDP-3-O-acyl-N-acetylglucosamine deacetylase [Sulfurovum sp.]MDY0403042.1 UDP-3-O-acyl-N-acetylglucosamine deacetylase [Sulfurovum sp.]
MQQRTIGKPVEVLGIGLHKGEPIKLRLEPLDVDAGIVFYREDIALSIPLSPAAVIDTRMATVIGSEKGFISTIEHFLSAVYAYGIDNLRVVVDENEMPAMDGSAISFCLLLEEAGIVEQNAPKKVIRVKKPVEVREGEKFVRLSPYHSAVFDFRVKFDHPVIGEQSHSFLFSTESFVNEIARARTFGFAKDIQYLQSQNLALGASLQNAIGLDDHKVLNPEGLRFENEFARHKILDAMGDMMVSGHNILGKYDSFAGSHHLNYQLTSKLLADTASYEFVTVNELQSREFAKSFA